MRRKKIKQNVYQCMGKYRLFSHGTLEWSGNAKHHRFVDSATHLVQPLIYQVHVGDRCRVYFTRSYTRAASANINS